MFFNLIAKNHKFVFHNSIECNKKRGFTVYIVIDYSLGVKSDLEKSLLELKDNNSHALELFAIDINPLLVVQTQDVVIKDNAVGCMLFCVSASKDLDQSRSKLNVAEKIIGEEVHINCVYNGIVCRTEA